MIARIGDRQVFVDTSAYYAVVNQRDANHAEGIAAWRRLLAERKRLITTNAVLTELHGLLVNRINRQVAYTTHIELRQSQIVVRVRQRDESRAEAILAQYDDKAFSLTDAASFAVIERLGIRTAFALDRHFAQFGWEIIPVR